MVQNPLRGSSPLQETVGTPIDLHRKLPGYKETPLVKVDGLAADLGASQVFVKDESNRFGLPAFKILGASWATYRTLIQRLGHPVEEWDGVSELAAQFAVLQPLTLVAATAGNHGRAVSRVARLLGLGAKIFVPRTTSEQRIQAMRDEGAEVEVVDGNADETIARSAREAGDRKILISDTSWPGYETIPQWVIDGYSTMFLEIDEQVQALSSESSPWTPDLLFLQIGVGAFAASGVTHVRQRRQNQDMRIVGVEPNVAACVTESVRAGHLLTVGAAEDCIMGGLNCGTPSFVAWPTLARGLDALVTVSDERARQAMRLLAASGIESGESGAAGVAGALELMTSPNWSDDRAQLGLPAEPSVLFISTEGAADRQSYDAIVGGGG